MRDDGRYLVGSCPNMFWSGGGDQKKRRLAAWRKTPVGICAKKLKITPEFQTVLGPVDPDPKFPPDVRSYVVFYANDEEYLQLLLAIPNRRWHDIWIVRA